MGGVEPSEESAVEGLPSTESLLSTPDFFASRDTLGPCAVPLTVGTPHASRLCLVALDFLYSACHAASFAPSILWTLSLGQFRMRVGRRSIYMAMVDMRC